MAAELTYTNGTADLFYAAVGGTPWHGEGVAVADADRFDWGKLVAGSFDYPLELAPCFRGVPGEPVPQPDGTLKPAVRYEELPGARYVWRPDTGKVLGTVGGGYEIVPNRDAFEVLKPLVDERVAALETGGVLRDGADAWLMLRWDAEKMGAAVREVFARDGGIVPFSTVMANHSGRRGVMLGNTPVRIVCANTLGQAEGDARGNSRWRTVVHNRQAKAKLVEAARDLFAGVVDRYEGVARGYRLLMGTVLTEELFDRLVADAIAPDPRTLPAWNPDAKRAESVLERAERKRAALRRLWREGKGHTGDPTAWYAYQGAVEAIDHGRELWPTRAGCYRTASLLDGEYAALKNRVLDNLTRHATGVAA
jgi:phage/plasmid-like protein (TIGR03299 family)